MSISSVMNAAAVNNTGAASARKGLGQADFLRLLTTQLQNQDPTSPVDNKEMLVQMAQFSSLQSTVDMGATLKDIAAKLDALIAAQKTASTSTDTATPTT